MTDVVDTATRSRMMSGIRSRNTKPELLIRKALHAAGFRFRLHCHNLPGNPDIVLKKHNATIFVNGCFWHGHGCALFRKPSSNTRFWENKIDLNRRNDRAVRESLLNAGWRVMTVWECALKGGSRLPLPNVADRIASWLASSEPEGEIVGIADDAWH